MCIDADSRPQAKMDTSCTGVLWLIWTCLNDLDLPKNVSRDFYFEVILPSDKYGLILRERAVIQTCSIRSKDFIVENLELFSTYPRTRRHVKSLPVIDGLLFPYFFKDVLL